MKEGGYEGRDAVLYTSLTAPFPPTIEDMIVGKVHELVGRLHCRDQVARKSVAGSLAALAAGYFHRPPWPET